ncbi:ATPase V [Maioricimonas sp. JC845]|uniref:V-type ATP synthase subunit I n=1 Tax=Maioricimonas sp. JC845 TaxID=3232138 RepID=UPI003457EF14
MSIVPLDRVTLAGLSHDKDRLLDDLHERGCLELIPFGDELKESTGGASSEARDALKFLLSCPHRRRQVTDESRFDVEAVEQQALELEKQIHTLEAERDDLLLRIAAARPWGDFEFPSLKELGDLRLWFYVVPHQDMPDVEASGLTWDVVRRDHRFCYVVVVSPTEPERESMPVPRVHIGARSLRELDQRLEDVELALEDTQAERESLTRWCLLFARNLDRLEDAAARADAARQTCDNDPAFALQAWVPREHVAELADYAAKNGFVFDSRRPTEDESPPTLVRNAPRTSAGEDLVNFYMTPGYWTWDPSATVLVSFAIFFAMILADAGYAAVLGLGLLFGWRKLGTSQSGRRYRPLLALIVLASLIYGILVGSYFGVTPPQDSLPGRLQLLDFNNSALMMGVAVLVGGLHVLLANVMDARRRVDWRDGLASIGWACAVGGGLLFGAGAAIPAVEWLKPVGGGAVVLGLLLVVGFTARHEKPLKRLLFGLLGLTKVSGAFGDVLSYLRLFALGLASASLAMAFNDMAADIRSGMPRIGLLLALLVLAFGHSLNLLLGVSSGVIHGLRLNVIEFFNWGLKDEGRSFRPFRRREGSLWQ